MVGRRPAVFLRDVIDVAGIFREAAPRIHDVVEVVRAEDVAAEAPAFLVALVVHAHGAEADIVNAGDVPAAMVEAGRRRFHQRQHVMVAAVNAVHEGDEVRRAIRQAQAERALVELDRLEHVAGEDQHVRQTARPHRRRLGAHGGAGLAGGNRHPLAVRFLVGRHFRRHLDFHQHAFVVAKPEAVALETRRRVDQLDALAFDAGLEPADVLGVTAERQVVQRLGLALDHGTPAMVMTEGLELK